MDQNERRMKLIQDLLAERPEYRGTDIPDSVQEQKRMLRSLFNVRLLGKISEGFLKIQDEYLQETNNDRGITELSELTPIEEGIYLLQGDITTLRCDAIVNAANSGMTGCYQPCHNCIDNAIPYQITQAS